MRWLDWLLGRPVLDRDAVLSDIQRRAVRLEMEQQIRFKTLGELIMATADEIVAQFDAETDRVAGVLTDIKQELADALAGTDAAANAAVQDALAKFDEPLARLREVGKDPENPVPPVDDNPPADSGDDSGSDDGSGTDQGTDDGSGDGSTPTV